VNPQKEKKGKKGGRAIGIPSSIHVRGECDPSSHANIRKYEEEKGGEKEG